MKNEVTIDRLFRRVTIRASGQWDMALANAYHEDMELVLKWSLETGEPISIYADLDGLVLHTAEVSKRIAEAVQLMRGFPIEKYALIVPSFLMRMQCRRLLGGIAHSYFDDKISAMAWLGWARGVAQKPISRINATPPGSYKTQRAL